MRLKKLMIFSLVLLHMVCLSQDATFTSTGSGNWEVAVGDMGSPWSITSGSDADGIPDLSDDVIVQAGHVINCISNNNTNCKSFDNSGEIAINSSYEFRVWGYGATSINNGVLSGTNKLRFVTTSTFQGTGTIPNAKVQINNGNLYIDSDITFNSDVILISGGDLYVNSGSTLTISGSIRASAYCDMYNSGTINVTDSRFFNVNQPPDVCFNSLNHWV